MVAGSTVRNRLFPIVEQSPVSRLDNCVRASREGKLEGVGKGQRVPSELELELPRARKELAEVRQERDLLKTYLISEKP